MKQIWRKLGLIYSPETGARHPKLISHAANPLPVRLRGDLYRFFYSGRDIQHRSSVGAVDVDLSTLKVVRTYTKPFFEHGPAGTFYSDGVSIGCCYRHEGATYMLFMGWQNPAGDHWRGDIGRLIVDHNMTLKLDDDAPMLGSDANVDPISLSYPWVMECQDGGYRMWYGSTLHWEGENGEMLHVINHATSSDGKVWQRLGLAVPYQIGLAQAFSKPCVLANPDGSLTMWFSYRNGLGTSYRIGCAQSPNGEKWMLDLANSGIDVSADGWDSEMIAYPYVFDHGGRRYMCYNGNGYGKTGFGLAVLED